MKDFFNSENIEYFSEVAYSSLSVINERKKNDLESKYFVPESAVVFLMPYFVGNKTTNLSVYSQVPDYHLYMKELTCRFEKYMAKNYPDISVFGCSDNSHINEVDAALKTGLGVIGKNGLVQNEKYGSFIFIGIFFLSKKISQSPVLKTKKCRECNLCIKNCPTGAINDPERKKCLSLITQKKHLTSEEEILIKNAECKWGCDICQNVCPANVNAKITPIAFFHSDIVTSLSETSSEESEEGFKKRAYSWRGREIIRRNLKK